MMSEVGHSAGSIKLGTDTLLRKRKERWKSIQLQQFRRQWQPTNDVQSHSQLKQRQLHRSVLIKSQMMDRGSTYSSKSATDIPLYEAPGASFDVYLEDKPRVFRAIFPDQKRSQRINEEEWRIKMLPIDFLFLTVCPVVDMRLRCKSKGQDYPPGVPPHISKVLELDITRWQLCGLDYSVQPSQFSLGVKGALFVDRQQGRIRLKGLLEMTIVIVLPPFLAIIPEDALRTVLESVLKRLVENMEHKVNDSLLADYSQFHKDKSETSSNLSTH